MTQYDAVSYLCEPLSDPAVRWHASVKLLGSLKSQLGSQRTSFVQQHWRLNSTLAQLSLNLKIMNLKEKGKITNVPILFRDTL